MERAEEVRLAGHVVRKSIGLLVLAIRVRHSNVDVTPVVGKPRMLLALRFNEQPRACLHSAARVARKSRANPMDLQPWHANVTSTRCASSRERHSSARQEALESFVLRV